MGIKDVLATPWVYDLAQYVLRGTAYAPLFVNDYIRARKGNRILDIGCGTGVLLDYLPETDYVGFDMSAHYIAACRKRHGSKGTFHQCELTADTVADYGEFDIVVATGVVHHLDDGAAKNLCNMAREALRPGGRLITLDGCYAPSQSAVAKILLDNDRGKYVRTEQGYRELASTAFKDVRCTILHDMFRVPCTVNIMECTN
jgi:SAM-dependent methyltransferase